MNKLRPGIYEHSKSRGRYQVLGVGRHSEDVNVELVIYKALQAKGEFQKGQIWLRPLEDFLENVTIGGEIVPRFRYIGGVE